MNVSRRLSQVEKYRLAFEISPVPLLLVNGAGKIVLTNELLDELFEYQEGELSEQDVEILVPSDACKHHPELRGAYFRVPTKRGMGAGRDLFGVTRSGNVIPLELALEPVSEDDETWAMVAAVDIRRRKSHEERMHLAMSAAASAMVMVDAKGDIVFTNQAAARMFGYDDEELIGKRVEALVPEHFRRVHPVYRHSFIQTTVARPMGLGGDLYASHKDGKAIPVEIALTPVDTPDGKMVMSTIIDLTERVAAERAMAKKQAELEALNLDLSRFAFGASHDLKAPLASIIGLLEYCKEDLEERDLEGLKTNLTKALEMSYRSSDRVEDVLRIANVGRNEIPVEPVDLDALVREVWQDLTGGSPNGLKLSLILNLNEPFLAERPTLKVILENLISNSIRYRDDDKSDLTVEVRAKLDGGDLHVSVADNGLGIPEEHHNDVFKMFKRIDDRSGNGLGLTLARRQIERLSGTISFESIQGSGTEFTFTLPITGKSQ